MSTAPPPHPASPVSASTVDDVDADRGWRYVTRVLPDGQEIWETVALTEADFLDPQEGDVMPQRPEHEQATRDLMNMLTAHYHQDGLYTVFHDLKMDWGIAGLERPSPDIAIIPGVRDPHAIEGIFYVPIEGTRPVLVIEVVSPGYMDADINPTKKVRIYARAGIREYVILDPGGYPGIPVVGYRLGRNRRYQPLPLDADGLVRCASVNLRIGLVGKQAVVIDTATGIPLLTHEGQIERRVQAEAQVAAETQRRVQAEARADAEAQGRAQAEAELVRLRAEILRLRGGE